MNELKDRIVKAHNEMDGAIYELMRQYRDEVGEDDFYEEMSYAIAKYEVPVLILGVENAVSDEFRNCIHYFNYDAVSTEKDDTVGDVVSFLENADVEYVMLFKEGYRVEPDIIRYYVDSIKKESIANSVQTLCEYITEDDEHIANPYQEWIEAFQKWEVADGKELKKLLDEVDQDVLNGNGIAMYKKAVLIDALGSFDKTDNLLTIFEKFKIELLELSKITVTPFTMAKKILYKVPQEIIKEQQKDWLYTNSNVPRIAGEVEKKIVLFYGDRGEYYNLLPIKEEAEKRGYEVRLSDNQEEKAEVGFYCGHFNMCKNSKFSVVLLHDMAQGHNRWPNLWELERWNIYDLGVLPGKTWGELWKECGELFYANPRCGTYQFGYPKSDTVTSPELKSLIEEARNRLNMKYEKTVLYAPSWEYGEKQDDFVKALQTLPINLLIKQADWPDPSQANEIIRMREQHAGKYENVYFLEPKESIMVALGLCDMVVSDESSVMAEALMFDKPSVAVTDWLIPDRTPPRPASVPMDYVLRCKKVQLREYVEKTLNGEIDTRDVLQFGRDIFDNRGSVCSDIMDAVDYYLGYSTDDAFMQKKLVPNYSPLTFSL